MSVFLLLCIFYRQATKSNSRDRWIRLAKSIWLVFDLRVWVKLVSQNCEYDSGLSQTQRRWLNSVSSKCRVKLRINLDLEESGNTDLHQVMLKTKFTSWKIKIIDHFSINYGVVCVEFSHNHIDIIQILWCLYLEAHPWREMTTWLSTII